MNLVLSFQGNLFLVACIFLIVITGASCSYRQVIVGDMEDKFSLLLSTDILSMAVLALFCFFLARFTVCDRFCC